MAALEALIGGVVVHAQVAGDGGGSATEIPSRAQWSDGQVAAALGGAVVVGGWVDAVSLLATRVVAARAGARLLEDAGVGMAAELASDAARERWRRDTKAAAASEVAVQTGAGIRECHDRVGVATGPRVATGLPLAVLARGRATWRQVREWHTRTRRLTPAAAGDVAATCFDPVTARGGAAVVVDPVTGEVVEARLSFAQFAKVLEREVTKAEDGLGCTSAARRLARLRARRAGAQLFEDGTGCLQVTGDGPAVVAAMTRVDLLARRLRHGGDGRTLDQLRADTALALLGYGQLPIDTSPGTAQPGAAQPDADEPGAGEPRPSTGTVGAAEATGVTGRGDTRPDGTGIDPFAVEDAAAIGRVLRAVPSAQVELVVSLDTLAGARGGVAELPGHGFITGEHAREVIGASGEDSVFHRVVTDPLDGRCVERSITAYLPDQAMLDQLRAVDRGCRAPGCTTAPGLCQPDHEMPFGQGGATAETNLDLKHGRHHWVKTARLWQSALEALSRKVTWTTLLGQVYATGPYDYRGLHPRGNHHPLLNRPERER